MRGRLSSQGCALSVAPLYNDGRYYCSMRSNMSDTHPSGPQSLADVANYFLDTRDDLLEEGEVIESDMDEATAMQVVRREFVSGTCQAFAVALSEHLDLPIVRVAAGLHMAVQRPDGQLIDFTGLATPAQMDRRYGARGRQVHAISREEALESFLMEPMDEAERDP